MNKLKKIDTSDQIILSNNNEIMNKRTIIVFNRFNTNINLKSFLHFVLQFMKIH